MFFAEVGDVRAVRLEDPQFEAAKQCGQGEVRFRQDDLLTFLAKASSVAQARRKPDHLEQ